MDTERNAGDHGKSLSSSEYRARLLTKLNCLIAVLEVAIAKITRSMDLPGANEERLLRIQGNLKNTLSICNRAKKTLESSTAQLEAGPPSGRVALPGQRRMTYRDYVELSSIDEYQKFKKLPPISAGDISSTDVDDLISRLSQG